MKVQLIRSATLRVTYGGHLFVVDPFLAAKGTVRSFAEIAPNPIVELPCTPEEAVAGVEMALISHLHVDHFDDTAVALLPKGLPILCQPGDEEKIKEKGFTAVTPITHSHTWQGITFTRTPGQHGTGEGDSAWGRSPASSGRPPGNRPFTGPATPSGTKLWPKSFAPCSPM